MKLPLAKYSVDGAAAEGSWALLSRCADDDSSEDSESEDENEFANVVQKSGGESMVVSKVLGGGGYPQRDRRGWADTRRGWAAHG